nr:hypothetical protein CFP56_76623 [Quercus suber]
MPIGRFATMARSLLANGDLNAKLCVISWIARKRFWFAVAPTIYAVMRNCQESIGVSRKAYEQKIWRLTTANTRGMVNGSGPHSFNTYVTMHRSAALTSTGGAIADITCLRMCFNDLHPPAPVRFFCVGPKEIVLSIVGSRY